MEISFEELLSEPEESEELYPFMVPTDEKGYVWHIEYMTKEEIVATLERNDRVNNRVSELVIENNRQYVTEFAPNVETYEAAIQPGIDYFWAFAFLLSILGTVVTIIARLFSPYYRW